MELGLVVVVTEPPVLLGGAPLPSVIPPQVALLQPMKILLETTVELVLLQALVNLPKHTSPGRNMLNSPMVVAEATALVMVVMVRLEED